VAAPSLAGLWLRARGKEDSKAKNLQKKKDEQVRICRETGRYGKKSRAHNRLIALRKNRERLLGLSSNWFRVVGREKAPSEETNRHQEEIIKS